MSLPTPIEGLHLRHEGPLIDRFGREHSYLRVSITDRCNYRCTYCMPEEGLDWMPRPHILSYEEVARLVRVFVGLGIRRVRLTGGEPTVRRDLPELVRLLGAIEGLQDLAMTTNGHALAPRAETLARAGLKRVNISLDALDPAIFAELTRGGDAIRVLASIAAARKAGLQPIKINTVVIRGVNDHEVERLVDFFAPQADNTELRFIEFMPFGSDRRQHVPAAELRARLSRRYTLRPEPESAAVGGGPARTWRIEPTGQRIGFISPITEHFCGACNRLRLMADGHLRTCLSRDDTPSLRDLLREGATDDQLARVIRAMVWHKVAGHEAHLDDPRNFEGVMTRIGG